MNISAKNTLKFWDLFWALYGPSSLSLVLARCNRQSRTYFLALPQFYGIDMRKYRKILLTWLDESRIEAQRGES
jgi:hypothetical protein